MTTNIVDKGGKLISTDDLYHNGIDGWKTTIKAVKDKYPKG